MCEFLYPRQKTLTELIAILNKELEFIKSQRDGGYCPYLWRRASASKVRIEELTPNYYYDALRLIEDYYIPEEPLFCNCNLKEDLESLISAIIRIIDNFKNATSLIAISEGPGNEIAGVLILMEIPNNQFSRNVSRVELVQGDSHMKCVKLLSALNYSQNLYKDFDCTTLMRFYIMCVKPEYRGKGLEEDLFKAGIDVARSLRVPVMMGTFINCCLRNMAAKLGMHEMHRIQLEDWKDDDGNVVFNETNAEDRVCTLMAGPVPPAPPPPEKYVHPRVVDKNDKKGKKKKKKDKKKKRKK